jgi:hypothetical protein
MCKVSSRGSQGMGLRGAVITVSVLSLLAAVAMGGG